ncbi:MAG: NUDIX domain-containing protein [Nocardioidaceae bacterium]|nr:NUDIX domain-containing protein [Nocardioidaceae bacterium]
MTLQDPTTGVDRFVVIPAAYVYLLRQTTDAGTEVLLQLRQGTGYMDHHWAAAAAGHIERGESAETAARREAAEELAVSDLDLTFATAMQRTAHDLAIDERIDFFFTACTWRGEPSIVEPTKCADLKWFPLAALPDPVVPHEGVVLAGLLEDDLPALSHYGF